MTSNFSVIQHAKDSLEMVHHDERVISVWKQHKLCLVRNMSQYEQETVRESLDYILSREIHRKVNSYLN